MLLYIQSNKGSEFVKNKIK